MPGDFLATLSPTSLTDGAIHHQDIRRPLGPPRTIPPERRTVLDLARTAPTIGASKRVRGLTLTATDLDWTAGSGPVVRGPRNRCTWRSPDVVAWPRS
ncbi:hypothetical protein ACVGOW_00065 [Pseudonocardia saturnea]